MDAKRLENALRKAGATIEGDANHQTIRFARKNGRCVTWFIQTDDEGGQSAVAVHSGESNFHRTIKQAVMYFDRGW